jgi:AcrR family transcriptional regulator
MAALQGVRERARAEVTAAILAEAHRQLALVGPTALSLRSVARELGVASSALYRYFASRDDLLTALIVEAYDALGAAAETAAVATTGARPAHRWCALASAIRDWAREHAHEYALLYGSPVPGYHAPDATIGPASRVSLALLHVVDDAYRTEQLTLPAAATVPTEGLRDDVERLLRDTGLALPAEMAVPVVAAWTQLFGLVSFELFGQTRNVFEAHEDLFAQTVAAMAAFLGLP